MTVTALALLLLTYTCQPHAATVRATVTGPSGSHSQTYLVDSQCLNGHASVSLSLPQGGAYTVTYQFDDASGKIIGKPTGPVPVSVLLELLGQ